MKKLIKKRELKIVLCYIEFSHMNLRKEMDIFTNYMLILNKAAESNKKSSCKKGTSYETNRAG